VKGAVGLFAIGMAITYLKVVFNDLPRAIPQTDTASHVVVMFIMANVTVIPLFTLPFWAPQMICLWLTYLGKNWARFRLPLSILPVWYWFLGPTVIQATIHSDPYGHVARAWDYWIHVAAALTQFAGLVVLWAPANSGYLRMSASYRRSFRR
jgi:hypothetical protein